MPSSAIELLELEPVRTPMDVVEGQPAAGQESKPVPVRCPTCGRGMDTDGDGNCAYCGPHQPRSVAAST